MKLVLLGGAHHVNIQRWAEGLSQAGAEVHILSLTPGESSAYQVHLLPVPFFLRKLRYFAAVPAVRRLIKTLQPDVVAAYYATGYGTLGTLAGRHPLVIVTAGSDILLAPRHPLLRRILRFNLARADLVTAWASHITQALRILGVPEDRIMTLPRGIPTGHFAGARRLKPLADDPLSLITTRSLKTGYKIDTLIRAAGLLRDQGIAFSLVIAGDGPERQSLEKLVADLRLEQVVRFAGFVPNDDLPALLSQQTLYVSLIPSDGVSASLLEAMVVGLCPIVPDNAANRQWIQPGENGTLLDDLSPEAIARGIRQAGTDLTLRERAWQQNPQMVSERADLYRNSQSYVERFQQLVNDNPPTRTGR